MTDEAKNLRLKVLRRARELLDSGWTQHLLARDADGNSVTPWSEKATCFCLLGAVQCAMAEQDEYELFSYAEEHVALHNKLKMHPGTWNDMPFTEKEDVLKFMDEHIRDVENQDA